MLKYQLFNNVKTSTYYIIKESEYGIVYFRAQDIVSFPEWMKSPVDLPSMEQFLKRFHTGVKIFESNSLEEVINAYQLMEI